MVHFKSLGWATLVLPLALGAAIAPREPIGTKSAPINPLAVVEVAMGKLTNAQRLARGLGLKTPTKRSTAAKAKRSGNPNAQAQDDEDDLFLGPLVIRLKKGRNGDIDEIDIGVITLPDDGMANFDPNAGRAQKFTRKGDGSGPFALAPYGNEAGPLLAVVLGNGAPVLAPGSANYVPLGLGQPDDTGLINLKLPLDLLGGLTGPAQGAIWTLGPNNEMFAHYANLDGSSSPVFLVTGGPCAHLICLSADINVFRQVYGDDAYDIHAFLTVA